MTSFYRPSDVLFGITDAYKLDHRRQYPEGTTNVYSNFTARGSRTKGINHTVHFGLQAFIKDILMEASEKFFAAMEDEVAEAYTERVNALLGPNAVGNDHIRALHRKGYWPLRFCAVPEGTLVPIRVPSFTIENTEPEFFWLTNYIETAVSASYWKASTNATIAWNLRRMLDFAANLTSDAPDFVDWQAHDFSFRGLSGMDTAGASGAAHLLSFTGTDTLAAMGWIDHFYGGDNGFIGGSVPATEHSVMCAGGEETEQATYDRLLELYPVGILSVVSDTWDFWKVMTETLPNLKDKIMSREGKLVVRPDSGDPADIICGTVSVPLPKLGEHDVVTAEQKGAIEILWDTFGGTINSKGYKELDPHVGLIYGDSITYDRAADIIERLMQKGFASTNVVFGVGSFTYQFNTRDNFSSAMKATSAVINGEQVNLRKDPKTDNGTKKSATGRLAVVALQNGQLILVEKASPAAEAKSLLQPIWENGKFIREQSFADVRATLKESAKTLENINQSMKLGN